MPLRRASTGPRSRERGEAGQDELERLARLASTGPRSRERGELFTNHHDALAVSLQRGRARESAESSIVVDDEYDRMELQRGRARESAERELANRAMGAAVSFNGAALERARRGVRNRLAALLLQWLQRGRARESAEREITRRAIDEMERASTGPRSRERGEGAARGSIGLSFARFNGAALERARRACSIPAFPFSGKGFNGAALERARRDQFSAPRRKPRRMLQRGRARESAERATTWTAGPRTSCFNGAALERARRVARECAERGGVHELQRGRARESAERERGRAWNGGQARLQRGRARESAESPTGKRWRLPPASFNGAALERARRAHFCKWRKRRGRIRGLRAGRWSPAAWRSGSRRFLHRLFQGSVRAVRRPLPSCRRSRRIHQKKADSHHRRHRKFLASTPNSTVRRNGGRPGPVR